MKKNIIFPACLIMLVTLLAGCATPSKDPVAPPSSAAIDIPVEWPAWIQDLDADDPKTRYDARMKIHHLASEMTRPGSDKIVNTTLDERLVHDLESATGHVSRIWIIRMMENFGGDACVDALAKVLGSDDGGISEAARRALAANPSPRAGLVLEAALASATDATKPALLDALAYRGDQHAVAVISPLLASKDHGVVEHAAIALGKLKSPSALKQLDALRRSADEGMKLIAEAAMLDIGVDPARALDMAMTAGKPYLRGQAFRQLAVARTSDAVNLMKQIVADPEDPARIEVLLAAMHVTNTRLEKEALALLPRLSNEEQVILLNAVEASNRPGHEKQILALLPNLSGEARDAAIRALGATGGKSSTAPLFALLKEQPGDAVIEALNRLNDPGVDKRLFYLTARAGEDTERITAINLLARRFPKGAIEELHRLMAAGHPEAIRKAALKGLESVGSTETCRLMALAIVQHDPLARPLQESMKRLCVRLAIPDILWDIAFQPAFDAAPDDHGRKDLLAILDGAAGPKSLDFVLRQMMQPGQPLQVAARETLKRWPDVMATGEAWLGLSIATGTTPDDIKAAQSGILRVIEKTPDRLVEEKCRFAVRAIELTMDSEFKRKVLTACNPPKGNEKKTYETIFSPLLEDPAIGREVHILLGKNPPEST